MLKGHSMRVQESYLCQEVKNSSQLLLPPCGLPCMSRYLAAAARAQMQVWGCFCCQGTDPVEVGGEGRGGKRDNSGTLQVGAWGSCPTCHL